MMKKISKILTILLLITGATYAQKNVCKAKTDEARKLAEKCKAMDRKSSAFQQCRSSYNILRQQVRTACEGGLTTEQLEKNVQQWQEFVDGCKGRQDVRCANALHSLGTFTFRLEDLKHLQVMQKYEEEVAWCADRDNKPAKCKNLDKLPKANHQKSLGHFMDFIKKYPKDIKIPNVLYQAAAVLEATMEDEKAYRLRLKLVKEWPNNGLVPKAWLRIGEYFFMNRKYRDAIKAYEKVTGFDNLTGKEAALAMYHLAESFYNIAEYETAAIKYYDYIVGSDRGKYPSDLRQEAMDFMAASFADLDYGVEVASRFLKGKKVAFKDSLYFRIGMKNKDHDRNEEAVECFNYLLNMNPNYVDAPLADIAMVEILVKQEKLEEAQAHRLNVVKRYTRNSPWHKTNQKYPESVKNAENAIRSAMLDIPQYHHANAAKITETGDVEAGKAEYRKAIKAYSDFLQRYAKEPTWDEFKVHTNLALVYQNLNEYDKAAERFNWIDDVDTTRYGRRHEGLGELIKKNEAAYNAVIMMDHNREKAKKAKAGDDDEKAYNLPETKSYFKQVDRYMAKWGKQKDAPTLAYNAAVVHYNAKQYGTAIRVLTQLRKDFPKHEHTLVISRMLAQANLENGNLDESQKEFEWLWTQYAKVKETRNDSMAKEIDNSIAAVLFQKADKFVKEGKHEQGATAYLALVKRYPTAEFADRAVFEAGAAYESAKMNKAAAETFMLMPRQYASSPLTIRAIMRAAQAHIKDKNHREAAYTFLFITENFPKDSTAFNAIGWAAGVYNTAAEESKTQADSANNKKLAAQTYEIAHKKYPKHEKTPQMLYSACISYEEALVTEEAIRCNKELVKSYPKSSYALDAAFSIPMAYQTAKKWSEAATEFVAFTRSYTSDKEKLIAAHYGAAKAYAELNDKKSAQTQFNNVLTSYEKHGLQIANADPSIPAEAAYALGEYIYDEMNEIDIKGNDRAKQQAIKNLTAKLQAAMSQYA
ncbi:MAG: tetratricopeptide repeat protein, partial [Fibrobacter sp.]|nr:tetratricopeptide repeat protein [Fibrobacter sp.]